MYSKCGMKMLWGLDIWKTMVKLSKTKNEEPASANVERCAGTYGASSSCIGDLNSGHACNV